MTEYTQLTLSSGVVFEVIARNIKLYQELEHLKISNTCHDISIDLVSKHVN
jgi:hypothetical protein